jgi:para-aminobenzoate synthetase component 1
MQIIDELEPQMRGPYCGAMGWISNRTARLSVGIRTLAFTGRFEHGFQRFQGVVDYGTGGGIVSDSDPREEYEETCHKAAVFESAVGLTQAVSG